MIVGENAGLLMSTEQWRASESEERAASCKPDVRNKP